MTQFIIGWRLELLVLMQSQIFWGCEGGLFFQVDSLYPVVIVDIYFWIKDLNYNGKSCLSVNLLSLTKRLLPKTSPCYDSS